MSVSTSVQVMDLATDDEALVLFRLIGENVILGLSLVRNGDLEITISRADAERVMSELAKLLTT